MNASQLIHLADEVRAHAHAPYSNYRVGAALLTDSGEVFTGVNVENASYGLTICAERSALVAAVSAGQKRFRAIAVVTDNGASPCGACRQVLHEFEPQLTVIMAGADGNGTEASLEELLPRSFHGTT